MNSNEKRWIVLLVAVIIIAVVLIVALVINNGKNDNQNQIGQPATEEQTQNVEQYVTQVEDGTKINTSEEFKTSRTYNNVEISNIQFTSKDNMSVLLADVKNIGSTDHAREVVKITLLDENGKAVTDFNAVIADLKPGESAKINASVSADVANVKDFKVEATTQQ